MKRNHYLSSHIEKAIENIIFIWQSRTNTWNSFTPLLFFVNKEELIGMKKQIKHDLLIISVKYYEIFFDISHMRR